MRDEGRCAFRGAGGRCRETGRLEFHHRIPVADGGTATVDNLESCVPLTMCMSRRGGSARRSLATPQGTGQPSPRMPELGPDRARSTTRGCGRCRRCGRPQACGCAGAHDRLGKLPARIAHLSTPSTSPSSWGWLLPNTGSPERTRHSVRTEFDHDPHLLVHWALCIVHSRRTSGRRRSSQGPPTSGGRTVPPVWTPAGLRMRGRPRPAWKAACPDPRTLSTPSTSPSSWVCLAEHGVAADTRLSVGTGFDHDPHLLGHCASAFCIPAASGRRRSAQGPPISGGRAPVWTPAGLRMRGRPRPAWKAACPDRAPFHTVHKPIIMGLALAEHGVAADTRLSVGTGFDHDPHLLGHCALCIVHSARPGRRPTRRRAVDVRRVAARRPTGGAGWRGVGGT